jgi:Fe-S-cluster containining protein
MAPRSKLPLYIEKALADSQAAKIAISERFETSLRNVTTASKQALMCIPGCASCCYYPVTMSVLEGIHIHRHLVRRGLWAPSLKNKLQEHAEQTFGLAYEVWLLSLLACPMLDKSNKCSIHKVRPFVCRTTYATGDPHYCHPHRLSSNTNIISRIAVLGEFYQMEERAFLTNGSHHILMPISKALLVAENVVSGEVAFEKLDYYISEEMGEL